MNSIFKKYYCIKQYDYKDCGCACLATISRQYGLKYPISKIREVSGTDAQGTSALGLIKAAESLEFTAKAIKINNYNDILGEFPKPAIAHVIIDKSIPHYVVIHKVEKHEILIADPAVGIIKYKLSEFFKIWTGILILMVPAASFKKGNETKGLFQRFWGLIKVQKALLRDIFISSLLITILGIIGSFYFQFLIDDLLPNNLNHNLFVISIAMIGLAIFRVTIEFFRSMLLVHMSQNIDIPLLLGYYNHVIDLPMNFFGTRQVGEIVSRFNDAGKIREAISSATLTVLIDTIMAIAGGIILYIQSPKLFSICFIPIFLYLILVISFKRKLESVNRNVMEDNSKLTSYLVESIEGIETVKAFNGERKVNLETEKRFIKYIRSVFKYGYANNFQGSIKGLIKGVFSIIVLWIGAIYSIKGEISIGTLISFNALLAYFIEPIERMINLQPLLQSAIVAADRLGEILDLNTEKDINEDKKIKPKTRLGTINFKNVDFRYGSRQLVLKNINMDIKPGEKIALVGESGSGKTTIAKILMNFYDIEKGEVTLNNYNIKDINKEVLRDKIAYISQESFFFSGTIKENLEFANSEATYEDMIGVCKKAQIHDYINSTPTRYDTLLEEKGTNLSGGQRQRLAIARALLKKPEILIMDEATSNLDSITEKAIENTIEECTKDVTTIIIAHRLSTIIRCDRIYVMGKGEIIEEGTHEELLEKEGYYYKLWLGQTTKKLEKTSIACEV